MLHNKSTCKCPKHGHFVGDMFEAFGTTVKTRCPQCQEEERLEQERVLHAETQRKKAKSVDHNAETAQIPKRFADKTLDGFVVTDDATRIAVEIVRNYVKTWDDKLATGDSLVICGNAGTGKTHLACAMAKDIINQGATVTYTKSADIFRRVKDTYSHSDETVTQIYDELRQVDLLVVDEIGRNLGSDTEKMILFDIINARYEDCKPIILISNLCADETQNYITGAGFDRMREIAIFISLEGKSYRGRATG